jgi:hypothetical protein
VSGNRDEVLFEALENFIVDRRIPGVNWLLALACIAASAAVWQNSSFAYARRKFWSAACVSK